MRFYRTHIFAPAAGVTPQTIDRWLSEGRVSPAARNDAGHPLWSAEQLREAHAQLRARCDDALRRSAEALIEAGVLADFEHDDAPAPAEACDNLREPQP